MRRPLLAAASLAVLLTASLAACTPESSPLTPTPSPTSSATPLFASDEEALAAAEEAFGSYLVASDQISARGGVEVESIRELVTMEWFEDEQRSAAELAASGNSIIGNSVATELILQSYSEDSSGAHLSGYTCLDVSGTRVIDATGTDVTPSDRPIIVPVVARFSAPPATVVWLIEGVEPWDGELAC